MTTTVSCSKLTRLPWPTTPNFTYTRVTWLCLLQTSITSHPLVLFSLCFNMTEIPTHIPHPTSLFITHLYLKCSLYWTVHTWLTDPILPLESRYFTLSLPAVCKLGILNHIPRLIYLFTTLTFTINFTFHWTVHLTGPTEPPFPLEPRYCQSCSLSSSWTNTKPHPSPQIMSFPAYFKLDSSV